MHALHKRWQSIDGKLPLLTSALVVGTIFVVAITVHSVLERALLSSAKARLLRGANVVAALIAGTNLPDSIRARTEQTLRRFNSGAASRDEVVAALSHGNTATSARSSGAFYDFGGTPLVVWQRDSTHAPSSWARTAIARGMVTDSVSVGPIEDLGGPAITVAHAVRASSAPGAPVIGYVTYTRPTTGRAGPVRDIIGSDVELLVGQIGAGSWTDLATVAPTAPPVPAAGDSVVMFEAGVGAYGRIAGTNLRVWLAQSRSAIMAPSRTLLYAMIPIGFAIALVSAALMWRFTRSITHPIAQLTDAAENIAADNGDTAMQPTVLMPATANEVVRLRYAFERMARRVSERQTLEMQLRHAQKMEAVGRLAGGVAHDFNNLLTAIRSYADLLIADTPEWDEKRADLLEIRKASERAAALTSQLLAFSRKQMLQPRVLDTSHVLVELRAMLDRLMVEDISLSVEIAPDIWPVKVDRGQLEQVIVNLAVNAKDAMPQGGTIRLAAMNTTLEHPIATRHGEIPVGQYVAISVSDTGVGMDLKTQNQVFEPFFTTKPMGQGTGLGLATVHGIVAQSGGFVRVQSEPKKGATFTVYLPRVRETPKISGSHAAISAEAREGGTETILLVEDEQAVRALARRVLERSGFRVLDAETPSVALALARAHASQIQLILSDVVMPEMNGPALVAKIAELCPTARVLFISGYTDDEIIGRGLSEPGMLLLPKPFSAQELVERVRQALDARPESVSV